MVEDAALMVRVTADRIPLTVCPTSNVVIANRYASLGEHPLRDLRDAGVLVTINTDDPAMMGLDLGQEYRYIAEALELHLDDLGRMAVEGIESTWLDESDRRSLTAEFEETLRAIA